MDTTKDKLTVPLSEYINKQPPLPVNFEEFRKKDKRKPDVNNGYQKGEK